MEIYLALLLSLFIIEDSLWSEIEINPQLNELEIDPDDWTYPWHVIKHEDYFESIFGQPITEEDTAHLIKNSTCTLFTFSDANESFARLPFARAKWAEDTLIVTIYRFDASNSVDLSLIVFNGEFIPQFTNIYFPPVERYPIDYHHTVLTLNQLPERGKPIKGSLEIILNEKIEYTFSESDSLDFFSRRIKGTFVIE